MKVMHVARALSALLALSALSGLSGCIDGQDPPMNALPLTRLQVDRTYLRDGHGRYVFVNGINLSGSTKIPSAVSPAGVPTYVGKPFDLAAADLHLGKIKAMGFNTLRLLVPWEAIEPARRGSYDTEYLSFLREVVQKAAEHGLSVLVDFHQDIFSRHLNVKYNRHPAYGEPGSLEYNLLSLVPDHLGAPYDDLVQGDGAPKWVVQACLQEKKLDSPHWGTPRILSGLTIDDLSSIYALLQKLLGLESGPMPEWVATLILGLPGVFPVDETSDLLPFTNWTLTAALSIDMARCFGCLFAGDKLFPGLEVEGESVKDYLQSAYAEATAQVAQVLRDLPNVIGYDLMNEPVANFIVLTAAAGLIKSGVASGALGALQGLLGDVDGQKAYDAIVALRLLPPDNAPETLRQWGLDKLDVMTAVSLNLGFDENYLRPFYGLVGRAILEADPKAVFFIEQSRNFETVFGTGVGGGVGGLWEQPMTLPQELVGRAVLSPHWYTDIYPLPGFNQPPRNFTAEQVRYRSYDAQIELNRALSAYSLGNIPVVFGEFGTYFNYNGLEAAQDDRYRVSAHILDNYYESFERLFQSRILWCYSPENDRDLGDRWNHEEFSIVDPDLRPRGEQAFARPFPTALAGKPKSVHYFSPLHYFDPDKGEVDRVGEFEVVYAARETKAPSEITIPDGVYPDGFYVWLSDGHAAYDPKRHVLYHYASKDEPGTEHRVRLLPPLPQNQNQGWDYFFLGDRVLTR